MAIVDSLGHDWAPNDHDFNVTCLRCGCSYFNMALGRSEKSMKPCYAQAFVKKIKEADKAEPEATFGNPDDMMKWLEEDG